MPHRATPPTKKKPATPGKRTKIGNLLYYWPLTAIGLMIVLVGLTFAGWQLYHAHQVNSDRRRFAEAEKQVAAVSKLIIAANGPPLKSTTENFCSRPSMAFGKGPLSCDVGLVSFYNTDYATQATMIYQNISTIVQRRWHLISTNSSNNLKDTKKFATITNENYLPFTDYEQIYEDYLFSTAGPECSVIYNYYKANDPPFINYSSSANSKFILAVDASCADYAKFQYYPLNH